MILVPPLLLSLRIVFNKSFLYMRSVAIIISNVINLSHQICQSYKFFLVTMKLLYKWNAIKIH